MKRPSKGAPSITTLNAMNHDCSTNTTPMGP
jgi:hypothetical protein